MYLPSEDGLSMRLKGAQKDEGRMSRSIVKEKAFYKHILGLSIPLILQMLLSISVDTISALLLGNLSQAGMTAVTQANQVSWIIKVIVCGFAGGTSLLTSQYWGLKQKDPIKTILAISLRFMGAFCIATTLIVMTFSSDIMRIYSSDQEIITIGSAYLRTVALSYLPVGIVYTAYAALRGVEKVRVILINNIITYSINIILDYGMITGKLGMPALGTTGIAVGQIISRTLEVIIILVYIIKVDTNIGFKLKNLLNKDKQLTKDYIGASLPIVGHEIIWSIGTSSGNMIAGQLGKDVVAGYDVMQVYYNIVAAFGEGFLYACSIVIGVSIGENKKDRIKTEARSLALIGLVFGIAAGLISFLVKDSFVGLYALTEEADYYAKQFLTIIAISCPFSYMEMTCMIGILRAGGDGKTGFISDIFIMWLICIPAALVTAFALKADPVLVVAIIKFTIVLEGIVGTVRVLSMKWIHNLTRS